MPPPILARLEAEISASEDASKKSELIAERAAYLVRIGDIEQARLSLADLRRTCGDGRFPRVSIRMMLAEGLIPYFENLSSTGWDRLRRAAALSGAMQFHDLAALASAWLAHLDFHRANYESMGAAIEASFRSLDSMNFDAAARLHLVVADTYRYVGRRESADHHYRVAHRAAVRASDQAAIGALMYNRAAFGLARFRVDSALSVVDTNAAGILNVEISSAIGYQYGTGVTALSHLGDLWIARAELSKKNYRQALVLLERLDRELATREAEPRRNGLRADIAWAKLMSGDTAGARNTALSIDASESDHMDQDECFVFLETLRRTFEELGMSKEALGLVPATSAARDRHAAQCDQLLKVLARVPAAQPDQQGLVDG